MRCQTRNSWTDIGELMINGSPSAECQFLSLPSTPRVEITGQEFEPACSLGEAQKLSYAMNTDNLAETWLTKLKRRSIVAILIVTTTVIGGVLGFVKDTDEIWKRLTGYMKAPEIVLVALSKSAVGFKETTEHKYDGSTKMLRTFKPYYPFAMEPRAILLTTIKNPTKEDLILTAVTYVVEKTETVKGGSSGPLEPLVTYQHAIAHESGEQTKTLVPPFRVAAGDAASIELEISSVSPGYGLVWLLNLRFESNLGEFSTESFWLYLPAKGGRKKTSATPLPDEPDDILQERIELRLPDPRHSDCIFRKAGVYTDLKHLDGLDHDLLFVRAGWNTLEEFSERTTKTSPPITYGTLLTKPKMEMLLRLIKAKTECSR